MRTIASICSATGSSQESDVQLNSPCRKDMQKSKNDLRCCRVRLPAQQGDLESTKIACEGSILKRLKLTSPLKVDQYIQGTGR